MNLRRVWTLICMLVVLWHHAQAATHTVEVNVSGTYTINGNTLNVRPGDKIVITSKNRTSAGSASVKAKIRLINLQGSSSQPIIVTNDPMRTTEIVASDEHGIEIAQSTHVRFIGNNSAAHKFGFKFKSCGLIVRARTSDIEVAFVHVIDPPTAGLHVKPLEMNFQNFLLHDNKVKNVGTEGIYIGLNVSDGPWRIFGLDVYRNCVLGTNWEGMQVKMSESANDLPGVHNNLIERSGLGDSDRIGIRIAQATRNLRFHSNVISHPKENGINNDDVSGGGNPGGVLIDHNVILSAPLNGILVYADDGDVVSDNLVIDSETDGIDIREGSFHPLSSGDVVRMSNNRVASSEGRDYSISSDVKDFTRMENNRDRNDLDLASLRAEAQQRYDQLYADICRDAAPPAESTPSAPQNLTVE